jgi:hypothetical protein
MHCLSNYLSAIRYITDAQTLHRLRTLRNRWNSAADFRGV